MHIAPFGRDSPAPDSPDKTLFTGAISLSSPPLTEPVELKKLASPAPTSSERRRGERKMLL